MVTGRTAQFDQAGHYGLGAMVGEPERVQLQRWNGHAWANIAAKTSAGNGAVSFTRPWTGLKRYRLRMPGKSTVVPAVSAPVRR